MSLPTVLVWCDWHAGPLMHERLSIVAVVYSKKTERKRLARRAKKPMQFLVSSSVYAAFYIASTHWHADPSDVPYTVHKVVFAVLFLLWLAVSYALSKWAARTGRAAAKPIALCLVFAISIQLLIVVSMYYSCCVQQARPPYVPAAASDSPPKLSALERGGRDENYEWVSVIPLMRGHHFSQSHIPFRSRGDFYAHRF